MAFSYNPKNATARDRVRRRIGDTQAGNPIFQDEELAAILSEQGDDVLLACASACREIATRCARGEVNLTLPGVTISRQGQSKAWEDRAVAFETEAYQRSEPTSVTVRPETDDLIDISLDRHELDLDFNTGDDA